jgi:ribosomal protein S14
VAEHHAQDDVRERKNAARRVRTAADPTHRRLVNLRSQLRKYGVTPETLQQMIEQQHNRCAICGDAPDPNGIKASSRLHVDHDHATGQIRDLLCTRCNRGAGYFRDDPALLRSAAEYIERHRRPTKDVPSIGPGLRPRGAAR